jgi:hypothetical protein
LGADVAYVTGTVNQEVIGAMAMMIGYSMLTVNVRHSRLILGPRRTVLNTRRN